VAVSKGECTFTGTLPDPLPGTAIATAPTSATVPASVGAAPSAATVSAPSSAVAIAPASAPVLASVDGALCCARSPSHRHFTYVCPAATATDAIAAGILPPTLCTNIFVMTVPPHLHRRAYQLLLDLIAADEQQKQQQQQ